MDTIITAIKTYWKAAVVIVALIIAIKKWWPTGAGYLAMIGL